MNNAHDNTTNKATPNSSTASPTPHQLVERHMQHPDEPVTGEAINNLNLGISEEEIKGGEILLTPEEQKKADELADALKSDGTGMSYKADI